MLKKKVWRVLEATNPNDVLGKYVNYAILSLIFLNIATVILGTVTSIQSRWGMFLDRFETFSILIFSVEYCVRLWACVADARYSRPFRGRLSFALRPMALLDLSVILPFFIPFITADIRILRIFRLFRVLRIAKVGRYYSSLRIFASVFKNKKEELVLSTALMLMLLVLSASAMFFFENDVQPEVFSSIPQSMWWAVATLTTVGYGDVYPVTAMGKFAAGIISILGIGMFALPTGLLGAGFIEEIQRNKARDIVCPHCGKKLT